jgi:YVTN family beta-propeller protein
MDTVRSSQYRTRPLRIGRGVVALSTVLLISPVAVAQARANTGRLHSMTAASAPRPGPPTVPVGLGPFGIAINHRTGSVYVADRSGLALIDGRNCNARVIVGCAQTPVAIPAGHGGIGIVLSEITNTVYVANGDDNSVSIIDGASCNAQDTDGCASAHASAPVGLSPSHLAIDETSDTLYVANEGAAAVSMIDTSSCNSRAISGCGQLAPTVATGRAPNGLTIDSQTHTLYVSNGADNTVSVVSVATCNARVQIGCRSEAPSVRLAGPSVGGALDEATRTLFEPTVSALPGGDAPGALSMIDTSTCNAALFTGCSRTPRRIGIGSGPIDVAVNALTRRAYVVNETDNDVSVVDITRCNARQAADCRAVSPTMGIGYNGGAVAVDAATDTIYASSQDEGTVRVLDGATCNEHRTSGCRHPVPTTAVGVGAAESTLDRTTGTLYVANNGANTVSVIDTSACNTTSLAGCRRPWPTVAVGQYPMSAVADEDLGTLYVANLNSSTVSVIDTRTCNAHTTTGCGKRPATIAVSGGAIAIAIALDPLTQTVYVTNFDGGTVSIINARTCNARTTTGCGQTPHAVRVGVRPGALLLDRTTRTLYIADLNNKAVLLIDAATCNATTFAGCSIARPTVPLVAVPTSMTLGTRPATLYVSIEDDSSLAMIDITHCNARITVGCSNAPRTARVGYFPSGLAIDDRSGDVLVGNVGDSTLSVIDEAGCNASTTVGCSGHARTVDTGGRPEDLTVDTSTGTLYVSDNADAAVSIVNIRHLTHPSRRVSHDPDRAASQAQG